MSAIGARSARRRAQAHQRWPSDVRLNHRSGRTASRPQPRWNWTGSVSRSPA